MGGLLLSQDVQIIRRIATPGGGVVNNIVYQSGGSTTCRGGSTVTTFACENTVTLTTGWTTYVWCSGYNAVTVNSADDGETPTNIYSALSANQSNGNATGRLFVSRNVTGGTYTIRCLYSSGAYPGIAVLSYSNVATSSSSDGIDDSNTGTSSTPDPGTVATTNAADLLLACATSDYGSTANWQNPQDFTIRQSEGNGSLYSTFACAERIVTSTSTYGSAFSISSSAGWVAVLAAEKSN